MPASLFFWRGVNIALDVKLALVVRVYCLNYMLCDGIYYYVKLVKGAKNTGNSI